MPEGSTGHVSEELLPCTLEWRAPQVLSEHQCARGACTARPWFSFGAPGDHSHRLGWYWRETFACCSQETLLSPSLLLSGIISLDNNKQEGASRLLLHGLGTLLSLVPQAPEKGAKPFIMFISDEVLLAWNSWLKLCLIPFSFSVFFPEERSLYWYTTQWEKLLFFSLDILKYLVHFSSLIFLFLQPPRAVQSPTTHVALICYCEDPDTFLTAAGVLTTHSRAEEGNLTQQIDQAGNLWKVSLSFFLLMPLFLLSPSFLSLTHKKMAVCKVSIFFFFLITWKTGSQTHQRFLRSKSQTQSWQKPTLKLPDQIQSSLYLSYSFLGCIHNISTVSLRGG